MKTRNGEARGVLQMNRNLGAASALSGRAGRMAPTAKHNRAKDKSSLRKEFS